MPYLNYKWHKYLLGMNEHLSMASNHLCGVWEVAALGAEPLSLLKWMQSMVSTLRQLLNSDRARFSPLLRHSLCVSSEPEKHSHQEAPPQELWKVLAITSKVITIPTCSATSSKESGLHPFASNQQLSLFDFHHYIYHYLICSYLCLWWERG